MRKYQIQIALFAVLALFTITSCQKDGSEGPVGPAGAAGPAGPQGPAGVANVIYSDWLDVEYGYVIPTPGDTIGYGASIIASKLTMDIANKGEVKVYINFGTAVDPYVYPLPYVETNGIVINCSFYEGGIDLFSNVDASSGTNTAGAKVLQYRYVLIPGGVLAVKPSDIHLDNYKEVQKYFNLRN